MSDQILPNQTPSTTSDNADLIALTTATLLISFGVAMLAFSVLYVKDVAYLREVPQAVWDFICGRPNQSGITLPLLLTLGTLTIGGGVGVLVWNKRRQSREL